MDSELNDSALDEVCFFARSPSRVRILELLREHEADLASIRSQLSISHSTAKRNLGDLIERQYVVENTTDATYSVSVPGEIIYHYLRDICAFVGTTLSLCEFCRYFPKRIPLSPERLGDVTVTTVTRSRPFKPLYRFVERLEAATTARLFNPGSNPTYIDALVTRLEDPECETELVLTEASATDFRTWGDVALPEPTPDAESTVFIGKSLPRFGIALLDATALLVSYNRDHKTHAVLEIESEDSDLYAWVCDEYRAQREAVRC